MVLVGVTAVLAGVAAEGMTLAESPEVEVPLLFAADLAGPQGPLRLLPQGGDTRELAGLEIVVSAGPRVLQRGPLGSPGSVWAAGQAIEVPLASAPAGGDLVDVLIVDEAKGSVVGSGRLRVPHAPGALPPLAGFTLDATLTGLNPFGDLDRTSLVVLDADPSHPAGRKFVRHVYVDLSTLGGPAWIDLLDDGTAGDAEPSDGAHFARVRIPALAPLGAQTFAVHAVDLEGRRASSTVSVEVVEYAETLLHVIHPSAGRALQTSGNGCILVGGHVMVNSLASNAISRSGTGCAPSHGIAALQGGSIYRSGGHTSNCCTPVPQYNAPLPDPHATVVMPTKVLTTWYVDGAPQPARTLPPSGTPLQPGVYAGGISLSGGNWTMEPGVYILDGQPLSISGSTRLAGDGVFVYLTGPAGLCRSMSMSGSSTLALNAADRGTYKGLVIAQDRLCTAGASLSGSAKLDLDGGVYLPNAALTLSGGSSMTELHATLVVGQLRVTGGGFTLLRS